MRHTIIALALALLAGCASTLDSIEAGWDRMVTPDDMARAEAKAEELRGEVRAFADRATEEARDRLRQLLIEGVAP